MWKFGLGPIKVKCFQYEWNCKLLLKNTAFDLQKQIKIANSKGYQISIPLYVAVVIPWSCWEEMLHNERWC